MIFLFHVLGMDPHVTIQISRLKCKKYFRSCLPKVFVHYLISAGEFTAAVFKYDIYREIFNWFVCSSVYKININLLFDI